MNGEILFSACRSLSSELYRTLVDLGCDMLHQPSLVFQYRFPVLKPGAAIPLVILSENFARVAKAGVCFDRVLEPRTSLIPFVTRQKLNLVTTAVKNPIK